MARDGVFLVLLSSAWFSAGALCIKALGPGVPVAWVVFARNAATLGPLLVLMRWRKVPFRSPRPWGLVLRGFWGVLAMAFNFWALPRLPLANVTLLGYAAPFYAALLGVVILGEPLGRKALGALGLAFAGLYLSCPPLAGAALKPTLAALASGVISGFAFTALRAAAAGESSLRIVVYYAGMGAALSFPAVLATGTWPTAHEAPWLVALAACATTGQLLMTKGFGRAPVAQASLGTLFSVVLNIGGGWAFFGERPDARTWAGCACIVAGILALTRGGREA